MLLDLLLSVKDLILSEKPVVVVTSISRPDSENRLPPVYAKLLKLYYFYNRSEKSLCKASIINLKYISTIHIDLFEVYHVL